MVDPSTLSPAELAAAGVVLVGYHDPALGGAVWRSHSEWLAGNQGADDVDRSAARMAAALYEKVHGSIEGLRLPRAFPCLGRFRVVEDDGRRPAVVTCDRCGYRLGVTQAALEAPAGRGADW